MGKLGTMEDFTFIGRLKKLTIPEGFTINLLCWENIVHLTIEDHRAHVDFKGDRSISILPQILDSLSDIDLDVNKAIVWLGCRDEQFGTDSRETSNVGIVQLGWVKHPTSLRDDGSKQTREASR